MSKFTEKRSLLSVVISIIFVSMIALSCGGGGGGDGVYFPPSKDSIFPSEHFEHTPAETIEVITDTDGFEVEIAGTQIVADFTDDATSKSYQDLNTFLMARNAAIVGQIPATKTVQIEAQSVDDIISLIYELRDLSYIEDAYPNYVYEKLSINPNYDFDFPHYDRWQQDVGLRESWGLIRSNNIALHDIQVGMIEDGVIQGTGLFKIGQIVDVNFVRRRDAHATGVAAIIGACSPNMLGVAPEITILSYSLNIKQDDIAVKGAITELIKEGARIINISMGAIKEDKASVQGYLALARKIRWGIRKAAKIAQEENRLIVISSGNEKNIFDNQLFPEKKKDKQVKKYEPYFNTNVMIVSTAAFNKNQHTPYLDYHYGNAIDIVAPHPVTTFSEEEGELPLSEIKGSSYTSPMVAGAAALLLSTVGEDYPVSNIKDILISNGNPVFLPDEQTLSNYNVRLNILNSLVALLDINYPYRDSPTPIANAGPDQVINSGEGFTLDASGSSSPDNGPFTLIWEEISGSYEVYFPTGNPYNLKLFGITLDDETDSVTLTFRLTVTNVYGEKATDTCRVHIVRQSTTDPVVSINVTAPVAGAQWQRGTTQLIQWTSSGAVANVQLQLRDNSGNYSVIANSVANTGSYNWAIPASIAIGSGYQIRVSDVNQGSTIYDHSDSFSLTSASGIITPTQTGPANASTTSSTSVTLQWTSGGGTQWPLQVLKDGASHLITAVTGSPSRALTGLSPGSYTWRVSACDSSGGNCSGWTGYWSITVAEPPLLTGVNLPQTGQTYCNNESGNVISCTGTGQDGDVQAGVAWPEPRFVDNGNGTITDHLTELIWLKNANCFGTRNWLDALSDSNSLASGTCGLTDGSLSGDWRLPNVVELDSLVNSEFHSQGFTGVQSSNNYWSASTRAYGIGSYAWYVNMYGIVHSEGKSNRNYVWPVRGGQ